MDQVRLVVQAGVRNAESIAVSPDGKLVLTGDYFGKATLWHFKTGRELRRFASASAGIGAVWFSEDGGSAIAVSKDGTIRI